MSHHPAQLLRLLANVRRRQLLVAAAQASVRWLGAVGLLFMTVLLVDAIFVLPPALLIVADMLLIGAVATVVVGATGVLRRRAGDRAAAVLIERKLGITDNRIINAVTLAAEAVAANDGISRSLAMLAVRTGDEAAARVQHRAIVSYAPIRAAAQATLLVMAVMILFYVHMPGLYQAGIRRLLEPAANHPPYTSVGFEVVIQPTVIAVGDTVDIRVTLSGAGSATRADIVLDAADGTRLRAPMPMYGQVDPVLRLQTFRVTLDALTSSARFHVDTPRGRSAWYDVTVREIPRITSAEWQITPPAYTGWSPTTRQIRGGDLRAMRGSTVTLTVRGNIPLVGGNMLLQSTSSAKPLQISLKPVRGDSQSLRGVFTVNDDGRFTVVVTSVASLVTDRPLQGRLLSDLDAPPRVTILDPSDERPTGPDEVLDIRIAAEDDVALDRVMLRRRINDGPWHDMPPSPIGAQRQATAGIRMDLAALKVQADDVISIQAMATDNHPPAGQTGESAIHRLRVMSPEQVAALRDARTRLEQLLRERASLMGKLMEQAEAVGQAEALTDDHRRELGDLARKLEGYGKDAAQVGQDMASQSGGQVRQAGEWSQRLRQDTEHAAAARRAAEQLQARDTSDNRADFRQAAERFARGGAPGPGSEQGGGRLVDRPAQQPEDHVVPMAAETTAESATAAQADKPAGGALDAQAGVPAKYRDMAAAYFRRLAEDGR